MSPRRPALRVLAVGLLAVVLARGAWAADELPAGDEAGLLAAAEVSAAPTETVDSDATRSGAASVAADDEEIAVVPATALQMASADAAAADAGPSSGADAVAEDAADGAPPDLPSTAARDPFESFNRKVYAFNDVIDEAALRPLAEGYRRAVPELARTGVDNFFGNLSDIWSAVNKLLQGKVMQSAQMSLRVATNTVFGLGGLLDPATEFGLERQPEDFGQTLGVWGISSGPYLVLPLLGPSTLRDTAALPLDRVLASPSRYLGGSANAQVGVTGVQLVSARAGLLSASRLLGDVALDKYSFLRDAYLARRRSLVYDGNPPDDEASTDPR